MKIIYYCYGGTHTSVVAAAIHVGMLPANYPPEKEEFYSIPYFDRISNANIGEAQFMGIDSWGNDIYCMGWGNYKKNILGYLLSLQKDDKRFLFEQAIFVYVLPIADIFVRIGGFLSRRLGLVSIGRPLIIDGIRKKYSLYSHLVEHVKSHHLRHENQL